MFLKIIDDADTVRKCRNQLVRRLRTFMNDKIPVRLGHIGASDTKNILWSNDLDIWMSYEKGQGKPFSHAFGVGRPLPGSILAAACEINFPTGGIDRRMGGAFARDRKGQVFVVHRGKIGGGRKGIGKSLFENHYRGVWALMDDGDQESVVAVIGLLKSNRFPRQLGHFVHKVEQIKSRASAPSPQATLSFSEVFFRESLTGTRLTESFRDMAPLCDQGIVIRDLYQTLKAAGFRVGNDLFRDLFVVDGQDRIRMLFHIRTDTMPASLHEGVTRLLLQSLNLSPRTRLFLVVPEFPEPEVWSRLSKKNVELLVYEWQDVRAFFPDLLTRFQGE
ncbi:MAG: hypothetical protein JW902_06350, partial [Syntrophaceae bacterium]|nr:hypothetical protein [Syntrophaceae bacterium]